MIDAGFQRFSRKIRFDAFYELGRGLNVRSGKREPRIDLEAVFAACVSIGDIEAVGQRVSGKNKSSRASCPLAKSTGNIV